MYQIFLILLYLFQFLLVLLLILNLLLNAIDKIHFLDLLPFWKQFLWQTSLSCASFRIGKQSLGPTCELLPARAMHRPGAVPVSHSSPRTPRVVPRTLRRPEHRNPFSLARPSHKRSGLHRLIRCVHGAPCLHSFARVLDRHALGMMRLPFTSL